MRRELTSSMQYAPVFKQACTSWLYRPKLPESNVPPSFPLTRYCQPTGRRKIFMLSSLKKCCIWPTLKGCEIVGFESSSGLERTRRRHRRWITEGRPCLDRKHLGCIVWELLQYPSSRIVVRYKWTHIEHPKSNPAMLTPTLRGVSNSPCLRILWGKGPTKLHSCGGGCTNTQLSRESGHCSRSSYRKNENAIHCLQGRKQLRECRVVQGEGGEYGSSYDNGR